MPVLNTLQINKSLEYVAVRSFFQPQSDSDGEFFQRLSLV